MYGSESFCNVIHIFKKRGIIIMPAENLALQKAEDFNESTNSVWPKCGNYQTIRATIGHFMRFLFSSGNAKRVFLIFALVSIYLLGLRISLPLSKRDIWIAQIHNSLWLRWCSEFLTGGALARFGLFSLGVVPLLPFHQGYIESTNQRFLKLIGCFISASILATFLFVFLIKLSLLKLSWQTLYIPILLGLGSCFLFFINMQLKKLGGPSLLSINAGLMVINWTIETMHNTILGWEYVTKMLSLFFPFFVFASIYIWLAQAKRKIEIVNISEMLPRDSDLSILLSDSHARLGSLVFATLLTGLAIPMYNLFFPNTPISFHETHLVVLFIWMGNVIVLTASSNIFIRFGNFSAHDTATRLKHSFWIIKKLDANEDTYSYLRKVATYRRRLNAIFAALFFAILYFSELLLRRQQISSNFSFGVIGLLFVFSVLCEYLSVLYNCITAKVEELRSNLIYSGIFTDSSRRREVAQLEHSDWRNRIFENMIDRFMEGSEIRSFDQIITIINKFPLKEEEKAFLVEVIEAIFQHGEKPSIKDLSLAIIQFVKYSKEIENKNRSENPVRSIVSHLIASVIWNIVIFAIILACLTLFGDGILEVLKEQKTNLVLALVPSTIAFMVGFGVHKDIALIIQKGIERFRNR